MSAPRISTRLTILSRARPLTRQRPTTSSIPTRCLHANRPPPTVPAPIPFVPDVPTLLTLIGRGLKQHAAKFPSWEALFTLTSAELKELGIEPPRTRKYLLHWLHKFRRGEFGPGGDFQHVRDGEALLRVRAAPLPNNPYVERKVVVNVPAFAPAAPVDPEARSEEDAAASASASNSISAEELEAAPRVTSYKVRGAKAISGPFALPAAGGESASVKVTEGMWEHKRGRKIDGGERRRDEIRFKRRVAERKAQRESGFS